MTAAEFSYAIDGRDRLVEASEGYFEFAAANDWPGAETSVGEPLWDFVAGTTMRRAQRSLVRRVREDRRVIVLPFRCDSPDVRREMMIRIEPEPPAGVRFTAWIVAERRRTPQALLDPGVPRGTATIEMCGWCNRFYAEREWVEVEEAARRLDLTAASEMPRIRHGICAQCDAMLIGA
ncbi:MAG: hypothetical protein ACM3NV_04330 [Syntrophothermus sp.]